MKGVFSWPPCDVGKLNCDMNLGAESVGKTGLVPVSVSLEDAAASRVDLTADSDRGGSGRRILSGSNAGIAFISYNFGSSAHG